MPSRAAARRFMHLTVSQSRLHGDSRVTRVALLYATPTSELLPTSVCLQHRLIFRRVSFREQCASFRSWLACSHLHPRLISAVRSLHLAAFHPPSVGHGSGAVILLSYSTCCNQPINRTAYLEVPDREAFGTIHSCSLIIEPCSVRSS